MDEQIGWIDELVKERMGELIKGWIDELIKGLMDD